MTHMTLYHGEPVGPSLTVLAALFESGLQAQLLPIDLGMAQRHAGEVPLSFSATNSAAARVREFGLGFPTTTTVMCALSVADDVLTVVVNERHMSQGWPRGKAWIAPAVPDPLYIGAMGWTSTRPESVTRRRFAGVIPMGEPTPMPAAVPLPDSPAPQRNRGSPPP